MKKFLLCVFSFLFGWIFGIIGAISWVFKLMNEEYPSYKRSKHREYTDYRTRYPHY